MDRLHEGDVGEHRLLVGGAGVRMRRPRRPCLIMSRRVQAGEDASGHVLLGGDQDCVVGQRHRAAEVASEAVNLGSLVVSQAVPTNLMGSCISSSEVG